MPAARSGNFVQDGPPKGGYPSVKYRRSIPGGGLSSLALVSGIGGCFVFGMYKVIMANRERREFQREEFDIRQSIVPFLQAESDVRTAFFEEKRNANEAELMKDVPNWEAGASVYKSRSYMAPMILFGVSDEQR